MRLTSLDPRWRVALAVAAVALVVLGWWIVRSPFVGLADNGDWGRYACPVGLRPDGRFADLPATIAHGSCPEYDYRSSFVTFLVAAKAIDGHGGPVHLQHLQWFWVAVVAAGWAWFGFELTGATKRPGRSFAVVAALVVVSSDVAFSSYFASLYGEALVIALLPALGAAVLRLARAPRLEVAPAVVAGLVVVAITMAKPSLALVAPTFVAAVCVARRGTLTARGIAYAAVAALVLFVASVGLIADPEFTDWNAYNLAFTVVAPESGNAHAALVDMGVQPKHADELQRFVGVPYGPKASAAWDRAPLTDFRSQGRAGVIEALATRPKVWVRMFRRGTEAMGDAHLGYLSNVPGQGRAEGDVQLADRLHPAQLVLAPVSHAWFLVPVAWVLLGVVLVRRLWPRGDPDRSALAALGLFTLVGAATQMLLALGDGYYELAKHLVVADEGTALLVTGLVVAAAWDLVARLRRRGGDPAPGRGTT